MSSVAKGFNCFRFGALVLWATGVKRDEGNELPVDALGM